MINIIKIKGEDVFEFTTPDGFNSCYVSVQAVTDELKKRKWTIMRPPLEYTQEFMKK